MVYFFFYIVVVVCVIFYILSFVKKLVSIFGIGFELVLSVLSIFLLVVLEFLVRRV